MIYSLEKVWEASTTAEKEAALEKAAKILGNLIHYPPTRDKKRYYTDDVQLIAAELLAWRKS